MSAMKKLNLEHHRSGWDLTGFPKEDRPIWRTLLPVAYKPLGAEAKPDPPAKPKQATLFGD